MTTPEVVAMQKRLGVLPDGFWGPRSIAACQAHLRALMPVPNPWPAADMHSLRRFYGEPGDESRLVVMAFPYPMFYDGQRVLTTRVHERCAASLLRVLTAIGRGYGGGDQCGVMEEAENYGGCYNFRLKRGGTSYSLHAYGAAIDLDADDNAFRDAWPLRADMPLEIMEEFAREGWIAAGAFWGYDAMHFQATR